MLEHPLKYALKARLARRKEGMSVPEAAKACGVDVETYERFEAGRHHPQTSTTLRILHGLRIALGYFEPEDFEEEGLP